MRNDAGYVKQDPEMSRDPFALNDRGAMAGPGVLPYCGDQLEETVPAPKKEPFITRKDVEMIGWALMMPLLLPLVLFSWLLFLVQWDETEP